MEIPFKNYYKSKLNILKVLEYRNYDIANQIKSLGSYENFRCKYNRFNFNEMNPDVYRESLNNFKKELSADMIFANNSQQALGINSRPGSGIINKNQNITTIARWHTEPKLGVEISKIISEMKENIAKKCIIIVDEGITAVCKDIIRHLRVVENISITTWILKESLIFAPEHFLVPKHSITDINTKNIIYRYYGSNIPIISKNDVMVKYLDANKGDVIEILRQSDTAPDKFVLTYRKVV